MDLTTIGIDVALVAAIVGVTKVLTFVFDPKAVLSRWYPLLPLLLGIPAAMAKFWFDGALKVVLMAFVYGALAAYAYKTGKTTILGQ
jgi:hypothetical protein